MTRAKKILIVGIALAIIFAALFYVFLKRNNEDVSKTATIMSQPIVSWQKITITEAINNSVIT